MGAFLCCPLVCPDCARIAVEIQRGRHHTAWAEAVAEIADDRQRDCVAEFLRGIYQRARTAAAARAAKVAS